MHYFTTYQLHFAQCETLQMNDATLPLLHIAAKLSHVCIFFLLSHNKLH